MESDSKEDKLKEFRVFCQSESGADDISIDTFMEKQLSGDRRFKCFLKCIFVKMGTMSESGELLVAPVKHAGSEHMYEKCKSMKEDDNCDSAYAYASCFRDLKKES